MEKTDLESRKNKEKNRLKRLLKSAGTEEWKIRMLLPVMDNTAWMCVKLEDTRQKIKESDVTVRYNNGGGQSGTRQNPMFMGYEYLWKAYMAGMTQIMSAAAVQKDAKSTSLSPQSVIRLVSSKKRQA